MAKRGVATAYPIREDWGWLIEYFDGEMRVMIGCASEARADDGYTGAPINWRIFVRQSKSIRQMLLPKSEEYSTRIEDIARAVTAVLQGEGLQVTLTEA